MLLAVMAYSQKIIPFGISINVAESSDGDDICTLYKVPDTDSNPGFYLEVARAASAFSLGIGDTNFSSQTLVTTALYMGDTYEEALEAINQLIDFFEEPDRSQREFKCYDGRTAICTLYKGFLGKHLEFTYPQDEPIVTPEVTRPMLKSIRSNMQVAKKFNKDKI